MIERMEWLLAFKWYSLLFKLELQPFLIARFIKTRS